VSIAAVDINGEPPMRDSGTGRDIVTLCPARRSGQRGGTWTHPVGVSCPVPLSRPVSVVFLDIGGLRLGEPNELDTVHLAAGYQAARYRFFYASAERLASRVRLLLFGPVRRVLSVKLPSHQFDVADEHFGPIQEWPDVLSAIPGGQTCA
jgi:hypothetical protein